MSRYSLPLLVLAASLVTACAESPPANGGSDGPPDSGLKTLVVKPALVPRETAFDGAVEAVNQSTVSAQTSGRVVELPYDVGDFVESGAVIARLTTTEQRARSEAQEAALAGARAQLAEAQLAHDRMKDVYAKRLVAKAQYDKSVTDLDAARARHEAAQASLTEAREGLGYTVIKAPYSGIVVARHVQMGETVTPGRQLMTGLSLEHLRAVVEIPQQHIGPLRKHRRARVILPDGRSVEASELRIPPSANPATHSFRVLVTLPQGDHGVFPGTLVKVAFVSGEQERLLVPPGSIVRRGEVTAVYAVNQAGRASLRYLRIGSPAADGRIPVLAGLHAGERIALDPIAAGIAAKTGE
jgi:RND family efflux transporter MFP subunit